MWKLTYSFNFFEPYSSLSNWNGHTQIMILAEAGTKYYL